MAGSLSRSQRDRGREHVCPGECSQIVRGGEGDPAAGIRSPSRAPGALLLTINTRLLLIVHMSQTDRTELLQGTLDLLVLKTLAGLGPLHGFGIARRIEQVSGDTVLLNQGTIYPALVRLEEQGWIGSEWGVSENNRRARFYTITAAGRKQLRDEIANWQRVAAVVNAVIATT